MAIQFKCEFCGKSLKADDTKAGKRVKCPGCSEVLTIPDAQPEVEDFQNYQADDDDNDDDENPFTAPKQDTANRSRSRRNSSDERTLADPGKRFLGALLDGVVMIVAMAPGFVLFGVAAASQQQNNGDPDPTLALAALALIFFGILIVGGFNLYLMATRSQSIAKYILKMQVMS